MVAGKVGIWDSATGHCAHMLDGPGGAIEWLRWHPKGDVILAGSDDFTAWLWNAQTGACMQVCNASCLLHVPDTPQRASSQHLQKGLVLRSHCSQPGSQSRNQGSVQARVRIL
jgi:WD40 repeat protein